MAVKRSVIASRKRQSQAYLSFDRSESAKLQSSEALIIIYLSVIAAFFLLQFVKIVSVYTKLLLNATYVQPDNRRRERVFLRVGEQSNATYCTPSPVSNPLAWNSSGRTAWLLAVSREKQETAAEMDETKRGSREDKSLADSP